MKIDKLVNITPKLSNFTICRPKNNHQKKMEINKLVSKALKPANKSQVARDNEYFLVTCKCSHVGRDKYMPITFAIKAGSSKEASLKAKNMPRIKKDHNDWCLGIKNVSKDKYDSQIKENSRDPYLRIKSSYEWENLILQQPEILNRLEQESNYVQNGKRKIKGVQHQNRKKFKVPYEQHIKNN